MFPQAIRPVLALGLLSMLSLSAADFVGARFTRFTDRECANQIDELTLALDDPPSGTGRQFNDFVESVLAGSVRLTELANGCNVVMGGAGFGFDQLEAPGINSCVSLTATDINRIIDLNVDKFRLGCLPGADSLPA